MPLVGVLHAIGEITNATDGLLLSTVALFSTVVLLLMRRDSGGQKQAGQDAPFERDEKLWLGVATMVVGSIVIAGMAGGAIGAAPKKLYSA